MNPYNKLTLSLIISLSLTISANAQKEKERIPFGGTFSSIIIDSLNDVYAGTAFNNNHISTTPGYSINVNKTEEEPNNSKPQANVIQYNDTVSAAIDPAEDVDYFKINTTKTDTIVFYVKLRNNSQLLLSYDLSGTINYWNYYGDSIYVVIEPGTAYFKFYSSESSSKLSDSKDITDNRLPLKIRSNFISGKMTGDVLKFINEDKSLTNNTGEFMIIVKKFEPIPVFSPLTEFSGSDPHKSSIFDVHGNSVRTRVYFHPNGPNTRVFWEYGQDKTYGFIKEHPAIFQDNSEICAISYLADLEADKLYHYRVRLKNSSGDIYSEDYTFQTPKMPDNNIKEMNPGTLQNYKDTSFVSAAGGGWHYVLDYIDLQSLSFKDNYHGFISGYSLGSWIENDYYYYYSLLTTTDGGQTWRERKIPNIASASIYNNSFIEFTDEFNGYFVGTWNDLFIFKSSDGGNSWQQKKIIHLYSLMYDGWGSGNISFSDEFHGAIVGIGSTEEEDPDYNTTILNTSDGGNNWQQQNKAIEGTWNIFHDVCFVNPLMGTIVGQNLSGGVILRTSDGGATWEKPLQFQTDSGTVSIDYLLNISNLKAISFINEMQGVILGQSYEDDSYTLLILMSKDGGLTWEERINENIIPNAFYTDILFSDSLNGIVIGKEGIIIKTSDGGRTWNKVESGTSNDLNSVTLVDNNYIVSGMWGTILKGELITSIKENDNKKPIEYELSQNYPNPFNPATQIRYSIGEPGLVKLKVFDITGRQVDELVNKYQDTGNYVIDFPSAKKQFASGVYFYQLQAGDFFKAKKMILLK